MLIFFLITLGILSRIVIHPFNFTPVLALVLFSGAYLRPKQAVIISLSLMILSDLIIGLHSTVPFTWGSAVLIACLGIWLKNHKSIAMVSATSLTAAFVFFVITNFGSWLEMYPPTWEGLIQCYVAAIPFFRQTVLSTFLYSVVLFGLYEWARRKVTNKALGRLIIIEN